ncbi:phospho-N-acetylmuramoyl-pentapeptide-transferase [Flammeovirgaceae bacterium SG7u.111]|nr:phospho-N-acetylmuramoyl-pentapeptide-transferase [Flammeovirgaceae bacterium SG7u.132]WPO33807.1 phospho-N-acetylmuramoyl-pentapeptide-transferase [Flammeovirgaceae bacterium SG7u.111]
MLYYLFTYLKEAYDLPGAGLFQYISFRALMVAASSLLFATIFGKKIIRILLRQQVGETVRDLGLQGQKEKEGTPTMGGLIIIGSIVIPMLLFSRLTNIYIILLLTATIWMGVIGFIDDYIKIFKKNKQGLKGKFKVAGQITLGLIIGLTLYLHEDVTIREKNESVTRANVEEVIAKESYTNVKSTKTTIPFVKNNELDYNNIVPADWMTPIMYVLIVIFIVTAVSNGANITDGIDGLAAGTSAIIGTTLAILAYVSGNMIFADYLNIMYIPFTGEVVIFCMAFVGACIGFLWYNSYPAQVFMGDTGSLALGSSIAVVALILRKELLIPFICGIFLIENLSVILQVSYFKYTKKKYGEGRRIFLMSPLHHHYQKKKIHESKIVTRFWIVGILMAIATLATLKIR